MSRQFCYQEAQRKFLYTDFVRDLRHHSEYPFIRSPKDYAGQTTVKLCCTQHSHIVNSVETITDSKRKQITREWAGFLSSEKLPLQEVQLCTATPQIIFDTLCYQSSIESLRIKWLNCRDIRSIEKLQNLKKLFIENVPSIQDISPLSKLTNLEILILGSPKKVTDYTPLYDLHNLKVFGICSYQTRNDQMNLPDDAFLAGMTRLEYLDLADAVILHSVYLNADTTKHMKYAIYRTV